MTQRAMSEVVRDGRRGTGARVAERGIRSWVGGVALLGALAIVGLGVSGCQTDAYCFNCGDNGPDGSVGGGSGGHAGHGNGGSGGCLFECGGGGHGGGTGGTGPCVPTANDDTTCDNKDDDCDGQTDEDVDFNLPAHCGTCDNNCLDIPNTDPNQTTCDWSGTPGQKGTCGFVCAQDYWDCDQNVPGCEYYCLKTANNDTTCDNHDDDCDCTKDEDVDMCTDVNNCGTCGRMCTVSHGTPVCQHSGPAPCTDQNTACAIASCDPGWWDIDPQIPGCEYPCQLTDGGQGVGVETCGDGIDNDCNGLIDGNDPGVYGENVVCYGSLLGECGKPAHSGLTQCQGTQMVCAGPNVLHPGDVPETCNNLDDDCDGVTDNNPTDAGASCGVSSIFPCRLGTITCQSGVLNCVGAIDPGVESCNGIDDDCDGLIDLTVPNTPPSDSVGPCNVPISPPNGATSPCVAGTLACVGGTIQCQGWHGPSGPVDGCNDDSNCDGVLTNQPDFNTDIHHCGNCATDCYANPQLAHTIQTCVAGHCTFGGCQNGYYDIPANHTCSYACLFNGSEACNNIDDDCDGQTDEGVTPPSPVQVCGVSPAATAPECTTLVQVQCVAGTWQCTFPNGVCPGGCDPSDEICDEAGLDNDCDGSVNENVNNWHKPCYSDDSHPVPGDGACRTAGIYTCSSNTTTSCNAVAASCASLPGGCDEKCDGIDNDCDGLTDESFESKGSNATYFVKPAVTKIGANLWIASYEASRPNATTSSAGTGNGYFCSSGCAPLPNAPAGEPLNDTKACSVPDRIPWFNVNPIEVEQTCDAIGGRVCTKAEWQGACQGSTPCSWGYDPRGAACTASYTAGKFCNLKPNDFDLVAAGDQDGLFTTAHTLPTYNQANAPVHCFADWGGLQGNPAHNGVSPYYTCTNSICNAIFDITGNLREVTKTSNTAYPLMGGAFNSVESGATCTFSFYTVNQTFKLYDTGFRCCFDANPTL